MNHSYGRKALAATDHPLQPERSSRSSSLPPRSNTRPTLSRMIPITSSTCCCVLHSHSGGTAPTKVATSQKQGLFKASEYTTKSDPIAGTYC